VGCEPGADTARIGSSRSFRTAACLARRVSAADLPAANDAVHRQRGVLTVAVLASFIAFLDGTVVNVALPAITGELGGGLSTQQWVVNAYLLTLGSVILLAGSLSDAYGRRRVMYWGLVGFGLTSVACALAPTSGILIGARALQGVSGALLVPSSLALILSAFSGAGQSRAIGLWTAWTGTAFLVGPLLGGVLVDMGSWRLVFGLNVVPIVLTLILLGRLTRDLPVAAGTRIDSVGAVLGVVGLGFSVFALIEQSALGLLHPVIWASAAVGVLALAAFFRHEAKIPYPMLPMGLFAVRNFRVGNAATVLIYGALAVGTFVLTLFLQQVAGYSATLAGLALLPVVVLSILLSSVFGSLAGRFGPRLFMSVGPILGGLGYLLLLRVGPTGEYWSAVFPGLVLFGLGLSMTVAPLTAAILGSIDPRRAGIASAVNNAVSRVAGLVAVAAVSLVVGVDLDVAGFHRAIAAAAILLIAGGIVSATGIRNPLPSG
jgi:EmrB/QacA subfamily drug resistance transporter